MNSERSRAPSFAELDQMVEESRVERASNAPREMVRLSEVESRQVQFLWYPYFPIGKLCIIAGLPGAGKSWIAMALTTSVTTGGPLPTAFPSRQDSVRGPGNVLYFTTEDGLADTLRERLAGMGADLTRVMAFDEPVTLDAEGMSWVYEQAERHQPKLIVIDPMQSYMGTKLDMHRSNETRPFFHGLKTLAEEFDCVISINGHTSKSAANGHAVHALLGSVDIAGAARSILLVGTDAEESNPQDLLLVGGMAHIKSNVGPLGPSVGFRVEKGSYAWTGPCHMTAVEILGSASNAAHSPREEAEEFLRVSLAGGRRPTKEILEEAKEQGVAERTLKRAKRDLNVRAGRHSAGNKGSGQWYWELPL